MMNSDYHRGPQGKICLPNVAQMRPRTSKKYRFATLFNRIVDVVEAFPGIMRILTENHMKSCF